MKLILACILCIVAVLGSASYVRATPYESEQFHDGDEEQPEIGESPKDNADFGKKVNSYKQIQSGTGDTKIENPLPAQKETSVGREGGSTLQSSIAGRRSSSIAGVGFQKSAKKYQKHQGDHFDHQGHEADKFHGDYDHRTERPGKTVANKAW